MFWPTALQQGAAIPRGIRMPWRHAAGHETVAPLEAKGSRDPKVPSGENFLPAAAIRPPEWRLKRHRRKAQAQHLCRKIGQLRARAALRSNLCRLCAGLRRRNVERLRNLAKLAPELGRQRNSVATP